MNQMTYGQYKSVVKPPQKGSFPLDHDGECKVQMQKYMACLKDNSMDNSACRLLSKEYLDCRMKHDLMAKEDWSKLGYGDSQEKPSQVDT